jgi:hypothetical protein
LNDSPKPVFNLRIDLTVMISNLNNDELGLGGKFLSKPIAAVFIEQDVCWIHGSVGATGKERAASFFFCSGSESADSQVLLRFSIHTNTCYGWKNFDC